MVESYDSLKMPTLAQHAREVLAKNYRTIVSARLTRSNAMKTGATRSGFYGRCS